MATTTMNAGLDAIVGEIEIAAPPQRVFQALIESEQLLRWWGGEGECKAKLWQVEPRLGGRWRFEGAEKTGKFNINGISEFHADGEIVEFDPPRRLAYTWLANWHDDRSRVTLVRWELAPTENGTRVKVTHSGLAEEPLARQNYGGGWPEVLALLKKHCERHES